jgi:hypothetical protein
MFLENMLHNGYIIGKLVQHYQVKMSKNQTPWPATGSEQAAAMGIEAHMYVARLGGPDQMNLMSSL